SYHLRSNMRLYAVQFYASGDNDIGAAGLDVARVPVHPSAHATVQSVKTNSGLVDGRSVSLMGHWTYKIRLLVAAKWHCRPGSLYIECHGILKSPSRQVTVGTIGSAYGPGTLVGDSSDSGLLAQAIVDGPLPRYPIDVTVRATGFSSD